MDKKCPQAGRLIMVLGCMFSGKTNYMTDAVYRYQIGGKKCIIIKHKADTRYDDLARNGGIVCNDGMERSKVEIITAEQLTPLEQVIRSYDVVGVSELQFFPDSCVLDDWANRGKIIVCEGLIGDYRRELFGDFYQLIPKCDKVIYKRAICFECGAKAAFTARLGSSKEQVSVGGLESYHPLCRGCYFKN